MVIKLAITVDAGEPFVKATYFLEGDGLLVFSWYEKILALKASVSTAFYPNTNAVIDSLAKEYATVQQQFIYYAKQCVKPGYDYFDSKFEGDLKPAVLLFKTARYFDPCKAVEPKPTCYDLYSLCAFPCLLEDSLIDGLKSELPEYMADVAQTISKTDWWSSHENDLPNWSNAITAVPAIFSSG